MARCAEGRTRGNLEAEGVLPRMLSRKGREEKSRNRVRSAMHGERELGLSQYSRLKGV